MMKTDFVDEGGEQIPAEVESGGKLSRVIGKIFGW